MRARDKRTLRAEAEAGKWISLESDKELWEAAPDWFRDQCEIDDAWMDGMAEAQSGTNELNRRNA